MPKKTLMDLADRIERVPAYTAVQMQADLFTFGKNGRRQYAAKTRKVILVNEKWRGDLVTALRLYARMKVMPK